MLNIYVTWKNSSNKGASSIPSRNHPPPWPPLSISRSTKTRETGFEGSKNIMMGMIRRLKDTVEDGHLVVMMPVHNR